MPNLGMTFSNVTPSTDTHTKDCTKSNALGRITKEMTTMKTPTLIKPAILNFRGRTFMRPPGTPL